MSKCVRVCVCVESWPSRNVTDIYGLMRDWNKAKEGQRERRGETKETSVADSEVALIVP